jgi:hypothetical protein
LIFQFLESVGINERLFILSLFNRKENKSYAEEAAILWLCIHSVLDRYLVKSNLDYETPRGLSQNPVGVSDLRLGQADNKIERKIIQYCKVKIIIFESLELKDSAK